VVDLPSDFNLNSEASVSVLNKINAADMPTLRSVQDSNKLLASLLEQQTILGNVTVQHIGVNVNHIHASTVEFRNESNQDVTDVLVTLSFQGIGHVIDTTDAIDNMPLYLDPLTWDS
jgi:septum formation inhibitor-activating ATPase MinD